MNERKLGSVTISDAHDIAKVNLLPDLQEICDLMLRTAEFFFKGKLKMTNPPFRGFILEGPPGTGKTEIVKQVARKLAEKRISIKFTMLDGASVAAPKWGEAENNLRKAFHSIEQLRREESNPKMIILFDDIESLMISRGATLAQEWHYAINSILFHELDALDPNELLVCATTNRPDLVDDAIRTRLYPINVPPVPLELLSEAVEEILDASFLEEEERALAMERVMNRLKQVDNPTIREARFHTVMVCIENRLWNP